MTRSPPCEPGAMWHCRVCDRCFDSTLAAIDHRIVNSDAQIYPVYDLEA